LGVTKSEVLPNRAVPTLELPAPVAGHHLGPFAIGAPGIAVLLIHDEFAEQRRVTPAHAGKAVVAALGNLAILLAQRTAVVAGRVEAAVETSGQ
jgi:hypothetical protein